MKASVQYNDYVGTSAADQSDFFKLDEFLSSNGVDVNRYYSVGVELYFGDCGNPTFEIICEDKKGTDGKLVRFGFEKDMTYQDIFSFFKRFHVMLSTKGLVDAEVNDDTIMIDNR